MGINLTLRTSLRLINLGSIWIETLKTTLQMSEIKNVPGTSSKRKLRFHLKWWLHLFYLQNNIFLIFSSPWFQLYQLQIFALFLSGGSNPLSNKVKSNKYQRNFIENSFQCKFFLKARVYNTSSSHSIFCLLTFHCFYAVLNENNQTRPPQNMHKGPGPRLNSRQHDINFKV